MIIDLFKLIFRKHKDYWVVGSTGVFSYSLEPDWLEINQSSSTSYPVVRSQLVQGWKVQLDKKVLNSKGGDPNLAPLFNANFQVDQYLCEEWKQLVEGCWKRSNN